MAARMLGAELDVLSPFSRADARRAGIPVKHLTTTRFRKLFYDLYISADLAVTPVVLASAGLLPRCVLSRSVRSVHTRAISPLRRCGAVWCRTSL